MTSSISRLPAGGTQRDIESALPAESAQAPRAFELLLAELSAKFINLPATAVDAAIVDALQRIVVLLDVDRGQLLQVNGSRVRITHTYAVEGIPTPPLKDMHHRYPWAFERLRSRRPVVVPRVA